MNLYYKLLERILEIGYLQTNKKGDIIYLVNQTLSMFPEDLERIFAEHPIAKKKLRDELPLYFNGVTSVEEYNKAGIHWWDYCSPELINSYPTYFQKLPALIDKINAEKRPSKNYVLFIGETGVETNQQPCLSLMHFQVLTYNHKQHLWITVYQRSADSNLGLPSDIYQTYLISKLIDVPLGNITYFIGNAHIYANNIEKTRALLRGEKVKFELNV